MSRKPLLLAFAHLGAFAAILFLPSSSPLWLLSALFAVCANVGFGASVVAMNAYLPSLMRDSPEVIGAQKELDKSSGPRDTALALPTSSIDLNADHALLADPESVTISVPLLGDTPSDHQSPAHKVYVAALLRATSRISSQGITPGYITGILLLLLALVPVT